MGSQKRKREAQVVFVEHKPNIVGTFDVHDTCADFGLSVFPDPSNPLSMSFSQKVYKPLFRSK